MDWLARRFELARAREQLRAMEGLRGFAVALVFLVHYTSMVGPWLDGAPAALAQAFNLPATAAWTCSSCSAAT